MDLLKARERARQKALEDKKEDKVAEDRASAPEPAESRSEPPRAQPARKRKKPEKKKDTSRPAPEKPVPQTPEIVAEDVFTDDHFGEDLPAEGDDFESLSDLILDAPVLSPETKPGDGLPLQLDEIDQDDEARWEDEFERLKALSDEEEREKTTRPAPESKAVPRAEPPQAAGPVKAPALEPAAEKAGAVEEPGSREGEAKKPPRIEMDWEADRVSLDEIAPGEDDFFSLVTEDLYLREFGRPEDTGQGEAVSLLSFKLAQETYAAPLTSIRQIIKLTPITMVPRAPTHVLGVISLRGMIIPVFDLRRMLKLPAAAPGRKTRIIIVTEGKFSAGLVVDEVEGVVRLAESGIEPPPTLAGLEAEYVKGIGRVESRMIILLDLAKVLVPVSSIKADR